MPNHNIKEWDPGFRNYSKVDIDNLGDTTHDKIVLAGKKLANTFVVREGLQGAEGATAANYGIFFIAPFACQVVSVREVHGTAGTDGGAVTLDVEKLTGTTAPGSGTTVLGATIDLKGVANTVQNPALSATVANLQLAAGDRLCLVPTGTPTAVADVSVAVELMAT